MRVSKRNSEIIYHLSISRCPIVAEACINFYLEVNLVLYAAVPWNYKENLANAIMNQL